jgi:hypothetical protein
LARGSTVYQGDNRYSLKEYSFLAKSGWNGEQKDKFFIRVYTTQEDAGDSYDAVFTATATEYDATYDLSEWYNQYRTEPTEVLLRYKSFCQNNLLGGQIQYGFHKDRHDLD